MKILTQNLKSGKTDIVEVPSPAIDSKKIKSNKMKCVDNKKVVLLFW